MDSCALPRLDVAGDCALSAINCVKSFMPDSLKPFRTLHIYIAVITLSYPWVL